MKREFIEQQLIRVGVNYTRMLATFAIGLWIISSLIQIDVGLYSIVLLVTVGLGFGAMVREILRAALVPFQGVEDAQAKGLFWHRYSKAMLICLIGILLNILISFIVIQFSGYFSVSEGYAPYFEEYFWLRVLGSSLLILSLPGLNVLALNGRMVHYNVWFLFERLGDLFAVQMIIWLGVSSNPEAALLVNGWFYVFWCLAQALVFFVFLSSWYKSINHIPTLLSLEEVKSIWRKVAGNVYVVVNMALYFRLTLTLVNIFFGESVSVIYGFITQVLGYLRQAVMGLVSGMDSVFAKLSNGKNRVSPASALRLFGNVNALVIYSSSTLLFIFFPYVVDFLVKGELLSSRTEIIYFGRIFLLGIVVRALSEHWMHYLSGNGLVHVYSKKIFLIALVSPILTYLLYYFHVDNQLLWLGLYFVLAMAVSHGIIIPSEIAKQIKEPILSILFPLLWKGAVYGLICAVAMYQFDIVGLFISILSLMLAHFFWLVYSVKGGKL